MPQPNGAGRLFVKDLRNGNIIEVKRLGHSAIFKTDFDSNFYNRCDCRIHRTVQNWVGLHKNNPLRDPGVCTQDGWGTHLDIHRTFQVAFLSQSQPRFTVIPTGFGTLPEPVQVTLVEAPPPPAPVEVPAANPTRSRGTSSSMRSRTRSGVASSRGRSPRSTAGRAAPSATRRTAVRSP